MGVLKHRGRNLKQTTGSVQMSASRSHGVEKNRPLGGE